VLGDPAATEHGAVRVGDPAAAQHDALVLLGNPAATEHGAVRLGHPAAADHRTAGVAHSPAAPDGPVNPGGNRPPYERNRFLGFPVGSDGRSSDGKEPQHVMGMPADWFEDVDLSPLRSLARPVQRGWRWVRGLVVVVGAGPGGAPGGDENDHGEESEP
jgi:hypothetical protein